MDGTKLHRRLLINKWRMPGNRPWHRLIGIETFALVYMKTVITRW